MVRLAAESGIAAESGGGYTDGKVSDMIVQLIFFSCVTLTRTLISQCLDGAD
jgi:hypothetical protein